MDVVHPLKLDPGKSGREITSYEGYFDVELDRSSVFLPGEPGLEYDEVPRMAELEALENGNGLSPRSRRTTHAAVSEELDGNTIRVAGPRDSPGANRRASTGKGSMDKRPLLPKSSSFSDDSLERVSNLDDAEVQQMVESLEPYSPLLHELVKKYPLISENGHGKLPYSVASSAAEFFSWNTGRQKSMEWQRAKLIQTEILTILPDEITEATKDITVKAIVVWCRQNRYGPPVQAEEDSSEFRYCRYCGMIEDSPPRKGQKRSKSSWGVDAYCRCSQDASGNLALMKTASSVQDMIDRNRIEIRNDKPDHRPEGITSKEIRAVLSQTDVNMMRWTWNTILQLSLTSIQPTMDECIPPESDDSLAVSALVSQATRLFLARMILLASQQSSTTPVDEEDENTLMTSHPPPAPLVITPIHILRAIRAGREFDFLTNAGMATESSSTGGGAG